MNARTPSPAPRKPGLSLWRTVKAVAWSFVGLRQRGDFEEDIKRLSPIHIMVVGLIGAMLFVGGLILLVNWVVTA
ncbi:MAG: DUF2970 domain-containing protein [Burkholderiales bacterium]|jgi:hypothetical protein|nr:DUF2970 domain-containing protein [Burkholderiales bacterium]